MPGSAAMPQSRHGLFVGIASDASVRAQALTGKL